jgi:hypothetical protein
MKQTKDNPPVDGGILRVLQEHQQGAVITAASEKLREATVAARKVGKPARITLTLDILPQGNAVGFMAEVSVKMPKSKPFAGVFFDDENGNLYRQDPNQQEMPALKTVEASTEPVELRKAVNQ